MTVRQALGGTVVGAGLLVSAGCGLGTESAPQPLPPGVPTVAPTTVAPPAPAAREVVIYLVDQEGRLVSVPTSARPGPYVTAAMEALLDLGTQTPTPAGLRNLVPRGTTLHRVVVYPDDVLVDLSRDFLGLTGQEQVMATAQVVFTATLRDPAARVRLSVDGRQIPLPVGDGALQAEPVLRADYPGLLREPSPTPTPSPG